MVHVVEVEALVRRSGGGGGVAALGWGERIATIGVYDWSLEAFLETLHAEGVVQLLDVRQRRAVRGRTYSWANSKRLQQSLAEAGIEYRHHRELAPTTELRHLQYREDDRNRVGKRSRELLAPGYVAGYLNEILDATPLDALVLELVDRGPGALFCVECAAAACHRSLIAQRLAERHNFAVKHLLPSPAP